MILLLSNDAMKDIGEKVDKRYLTIEGTSTLKGRLDMSQHRISGVADPIEYDDSVTKRYVAARVQALTDTIQDMQPVWNIVEAYNKIFDVIDNQILLKYEFLPDRINPRRIWQKVNKSSLLTNFLNQAPLLLLRMHYMQLKYREGLLWIMVLPY